MLSKLNEDNEYTFFYNSNGSFGSHYFKSARRED